MKKTILTTTMALGLGITGVAADQNAEASSQDVNKEELAQMAQSNSSELNNSPLHEGAYHYNFNLNGVNYTFESDGTQFSWEYGGYNYEQPEQEVNEQESTQNTQNDTQEAQPQQQEENAPQVTEESSEQSQQQTENTQPAAPEQNTEQTQTENVSNPNNSGGQNWGALAQCESGGDPSVVSSNGLYHGLYQFDVQTWQSIGGSGLPSDASAAKQTQMAQKLYEDRGSQPWPVCGTNL
ncbi:transglycosylase family protein [Salinicoccus albus]|uniref:transglycosylase family protein n=1 Tax=Salinicoccus albus TaxID=418756 RepID=UPI0003777559|nr:transglycosylase family protein [Salinicoccus albus]